MGRCVVRNGIVLHCRMRRKGNCDFTLQASIVITEDGRTSLWGYRIKGSKQDDIVIKSQVRKDESWGQDAECLPALPAVFVAPPTPFPTVSAVPPRTPCKRC